MVLALHFCTGCCGWVKALQSLTSVLDWLDNLIGLAGLLLVVSHPFAVPVLVLWAGLTKAK